MSKYLATVGMTNSLLTGTNLSVVVAQYFVCCMLNLTYSPSHQVQKSAITWKPLMVLLGPEDVTFLFTRIRDSVATRRSVSVSFSSFF